MNIPIELTVPRDEERAELLRILELLRALVEAGEPVQHFDAMATAAGGVRVGITSFAVADEVWMRWWRSAGAV